MKKIFVPFASIIVILLFIPELFAQQGQGSRGGQGRGNMDPQEMASRQTNQMKETLELTDKQLPKVEALNLKYAEKTMAERDGANGNRESMRSAMMDLLKEKDAELKKILSAEQWTKWEAWRKEARENGQRRGRRGI